MHKTDLIYVAGHKGLAGSALLRKLREKGFQNILTVSKQELDLRDVQAVECFFQKHKPKYVFLLAAKTGGIKAQLQEPVSFLLENLQIQNNVISGAHHSGVQHLLFVASSAAYPVNATQPLRESDLFQGPLESSHEYYSMAKLSGIKLCEAYRKQFSRNYFSVLPCNLYGVGATYDPERANVLPALIRKFHEAKIKCAEKVTIWGSGRPRREFLYADDFAEACIHLMQLPEVPARINVGSGTDISIRELAAMIKEIVGFKGDLVFDPSQPDGAMRKLLDVSVINGLGWRASIALKEGIMMTYEDYLTSI